MPSSGVQTCARSEEHTSELQSHSHLVCRLLLDKRVRSEEHTSELQSHSHLVCRLLLEKKKIRSQKKKHEQLYNNSPSRITRLAIIFCCYAVPRFFALVPHRLLFFFFFFFFFK